MISNSFFGKYFKRNYQIPDNILILLAVSDWRQFASIFDRNRWKTEAMKIVIWYLDRLKERSLLFFPLSFLCGGLLFCWQLDWVSESKDMKFCSMLELYLVKCKIILFRLGPIKSPFFFLQKKKRSAMKPD